MARTMRIKFPDRDALHHVTSRISGRQMLLAGAGVKDDMLDALERAAEFSGVNVGAFAVMDNHFHVVVQVPCHEGTVPESEVLRRYAVLMGGRASLRLEARLCGLRERGHAAAAEAELGRLRARMHDLSQFVKTFKEEFGRLFRSRRPFPGTLWEGRFRSTLVGGVEYLRRCAAYVEMNPVRAGLAVRTSDYAWNTVGAARRGNAFAVRCREWLLSILGVITGDSPLEEGRLMRRIAQVSCGKILGSAAFVAEMLGRFSDKVRSRSARARTVEGIGYASHGWKLAARLEAA
ncbi:MAG: transposase [Kiritimatiellae bacterium]|nr:transposase [Kiritimatiellia bacterium]